MNHRTSQQQSSPRSKVAAVVGALIVIGLATAALRPNPVGPADLATIDASIPSTTTTTRPPPVPITIPAPPKLLVTTGSTTTPVSGYDYCWTPAGAEQGMCADSFGRQIPVPITIDGTSWDVQWVDNGDVEAWIRNQDEACGRPLAILATAPGRWTIALPPDAGVNNVGLTGRAPEGGVLFAVALTTDTPGPNMQPRVTVFWPDIASAFSLSVEVTGLPAATDATVTITSNDGIVTELPILFWPGSETSCLPAGGEFAEENPPTFGERPLTIEIRISDGSQQFALVREWPTDLNKTSQLGGFMNPVDE